MKKQKIHSLLERKFNWYKKWHEFRYVQSVHFFVLAVFSVAVTYLAFYLRYFLNNH